MRNWILLFAFLTSGTAAAAEVSDTQLHAVTPRRTESHHSLEQSSARFDRAQWGLDETEWQRYQSLMRGIRGSISPGTLSPIEVLGIHARDDRERREYARRWARLMNEDTERILAFQRAYDDAFRELNPDGHLIDRGRVAFGAKPEETVVQKGDRILLFTRLQQCAECAQYVLAARQAAEREAVQLDLYFIDAKDGEIRAWAAKQQFDVAALRAKRITFNRETGELTRITGVPQSVPKIVRLRGDTAAIIDPRVLLARY